MGLTWPKPLPGASPAAAGLRPGHMLANHP
jgi:hypothetical protein